MSLPKKFLFDQSFEKSADDAAKAGKSAPKYSDEDLERARAEASVEGRRAGEGAARQSIEQATVQTLDAIAKHFPALAQAQAEAHERQRRDAAHAAITVVRRLFPGMAARQGLAEIESLVAECLERLREEPRIVVRVADALLDPVRDRVTALAARAGFEGRIVFLAQDGLGPGDARVEWADGGAERDSGRTWREIDRIIERTLGAPNAAPGPGDASAAAEPPAPAQHKTATASA